MSAREHIMANLSSWGSFDRLYSYYFFILFVMKSFMSDFKWVSVDLEKLGDYLWTIVLMNYLNLSGMKIS